MNKKNLKYKNYSLEETIFYYTTYLCLHNFEEDSIILKLERLDDVKELYNKTLKT